MWLDAAIAIVPGVLLLLWWQLDELKERRIERERQRQAAVVFYRMEQRKQVTMDKMRRIAREHRR